MALLLLHQVYKVDTAGDCYIVAGGLRREDIDGMLRLDTNPCPEDGARKVMEFTQVGGGEFTQAGGGVHPGGWRGVHPGG